MRRTLIVVRQSGYEISHGEESEVKQAYVEIENDIDSQLVSSHVGNKVIAVFLYGVLDELLDCYSTAGAL